MGHQLRSKTALDRDMNLQKDCGKDAVTTETRIKRYWLLASIVPSLNPATASSPKLIAIVRTATTTELGLKRGLWRWALGHGIEGLGVS